LAAVQPSVQEICPSETQTLNSGHGNPALVECAIVSSENCEIAAAHHQSPSRPRLAGV
jgi:hypothetical protein